jgi:hypothetical protein
MKEDPSIKVNIESPSGGNKVAQQFKLSFSAESKKNIRKVSVVIDDVYVTSFSYEGQTKTLSRTETVDLGSEISEGEHTLQIVVFDFAGFTNTDSTTINISKKDLEPPYLLEENIQIEKKEDGQYNATLLFKDAMSDIQKGKAMID